MSSKIAIFGPIFVGRVKYGAKVKPKSMPSPVQSAFAYKVCFQFSLMRGALRAPRRGRVRIFLGWCLAHLSVSVCVVLGSPLLAKKGPNLL